MVGFVVPGVWLTPRALGHLELCSSRALPAFVRRIGSRGGRLTCWAEAKESGGDGLGGKLVCGLDQGLSLVFGS